MLKICADNLRSFEALPPIEIRPLTFFVGRNSSGKSTATRIFPLLQQTFAQRTSGPMLWTGAQVDFGTIQDVKPRWPNSGPTAFGFEIEGSALREAMMYGSSHLATTISPGTIFYKAILEADEDSTIFRGFDLDINSDHVELRIGEKSKIDKITVNNFDYTQRYDDVRAFIINPSLFPDIRYIPSSNDAEKRIRNESISIFNDRVSLIRSLSHGKTSQTKINEIATSMRYRDKSSFLSGVLLSSNISNYLRDNLKALAQNKPSRIEELRISLLLTHLSRIVIALGGLVRGIFADAVYVGPIRASGERYYRWQELAVDRIDPRGDNLAMYLTSLPDSEVERVSRLLQNSFGCRVRKQRSKGHISIEISAEDSGPSWFNIADMGHGFSQLLPIVAQVHAATRGRRARPRFIDDEVQRDERIVAIEQPELHLHPAFQGRLANLFESSMYRPTTTSAGEPTKTLSGIYYVLETHSEALINAVGELISEGKINKEHVAVYVFDKNTEERTIVTRSKFSSDGRLIDWPPGFFMYERK